MIAGWNKLQLPLGADGHGRGSFTPPPLFIASRFPCKQQSSFLCRSYGGRPGLDPPHSYSLSLPELKASLVENLIGALIDATEILDVYAHPAGVSGAFQRLLGFEASSQEQDLTLASNSVLSSERLELLVHQRFNDGLSAQTSSPASLDVVSMSYPSQLRAHAHLAVKSSSAFCSGHLPQCHRILSVNALQSADQGLGISNNSISEEDLLLQEARARTFRSGREPDGVKISSRGRIFNQGLEDAAPPYSKQARDVSSGFAKRNEMHAETENAWSSPGILALCQGKSFFWGWIVLCSLLAGASFMICILIFSRKRQLQRHSVRRRVLKSQWYGSPGSHLWEPKDFQMRIFECPKYPILEVDCDKKLLSSPSQSSYMSASSARRINQPFERTRTSQKLPIRQTVHGIEKSHVSSTNKAQGQPIRQTIHSGKTLPRKQFGSIKAQPNKVSNGGASFKQFPGSLRGPHLLSEEDSGCAVSQPRDVGIYGRRVRESVQDYTINPRNSKINASTSKIDQGRWGRDDELDLDKRIEKLYQTIQAVEQHRRAAMLALEEERQRSVALEEEMSKQREVASLLGEEVRALKESHNALLASLRKKYSTLAAARTAADLVYQDWERHVAAD